MRRIEDVGSKGIIVRVLCICLCFLPGCCWRLRVAFLMILDEFLNEEEDLAFSDPDFRGLGLRAFMMGVCDGAGFSFLLSTTEQVDQYKIKVGIFVVLDIVERCDN